MMLLSRKSCRVTTTMDIMHHCILAVILFVLQVSAQITFKKEPDDAGTIFGSTVILQCEVENLGTSAVQWTRDGFGLGLDPNLPGYDRYSIIGSQPQGTYNLMISNARLEDDAVYQCQVMATESFSGIMSRKAIVTVLIPPDTPVIETGPKVEVVADLPMNLTCLAANGRPAPNVTWIASGTQVTAGITSSQETAGKLENMTSMLEIVPRKTDQGKSYECQAFNDALRQPKYVRIQLEVLYPPEVSMTVDPTQHVVEGKSIKFTCRGKGNPNEITWKWFKGEEELAGETSAIMTLTSVSRDFHKQTVSCEATNTVGSSKQTFTLNVRFGPRFKTGPVHVATDVGGSATLICTVDANPSPDVYWTRKGEEKIRSSSTNYNLYGVRELDFGIYTCRATSFGFGEIQMDVHLLKNGPPQITSEEQQSAKFGDLGIIECLTVSVPKPSTIIWSKDGKLLDITTLNRYVTREEDLPDGRRSIVEITSVQDEDYGTYNCTVENSHGKDTMEIQFDQKEVVAIAYILSGVLVGVVIIIVVGIVLFIYLKRRNTGSESGSESSEDSLQKKADDKPEPKIDIYNGNPIDAWRAENFTNDKNHYRHSAEYDELNYPNKERANKSYDHVDGYGNYGYNDPYRRIGAGDYGTYPGPARIYDQRFNQENPYGPANPPAAGGSTYAPSVHSEYGTYRGAPPSNAGDWPPPPPPSNYGSEYAQPPASVANSRLSTNV